MTTMDLVIERLRKTAAAGHPEGAETSAEIAEAIGEKPAAVRNAIRRLAEGGRVRQLGEAFNGAKTWTITDFEEA